MKALLMKDYWMAVQECRRFAFVSLIFIPVGVFTNQTVWLLWPVYMIGLIPYVLASYEEQCGWPMYADTMPYGRSLIVREKYALIVINGTIGTAVIVGIAAAGNVAGIAEIPCGTVALMCFLGGIIPGCVMMPIIFKLGVNKAKLTYSVTIGVLAAVTGAMAGSDYFTELLTIRSGYLTAGLLLFGCVVFGVSMWLSTKFYMNKEL